MVLNKDDQQQFKDAISHGFSLYRNFHISRHDLLDFFRSMRSSMRSILIIST